MFEEEKLRALRRYIAKRDSTLETELQKAAQRLYEKVVPAAVQEYISDCAQEELERKPQKKPEVPRLAAAKSGRRIRRSVRHGKPKKKSRYFM